MIVGDTRPCVPPTSFIVTSRHGYISSKVAETTQRGTTQCPWVIEARRGQRINVTLWDFGSGAGLERSVVQSAAELAGELVQPCQAYAVIRERVPSRSFTVITTFKICSRFWWNFVYSINTSFNTIIFLTHEDALLRSERLCRPQKYVYESSV